MAMTLSLAPLALARSEQDLVAATRSGDDRAFEELYSRYRDRIAAFILAKVHDHARAEDIAQDVFLSALRRLRASEQEIAFKPWIYEIAKNACIDEFRRNKRIREVSLEANEEQGGDRRALLSVAPTPLAAVESKQTLDDLQGAFGVLSESHHKLLVMREFEGLSYTEIGARTGMSRQVVESTLFRARRKLSEEYDHIASGRRCEQVQALIAEGRAQSARACGIRQRRQLTRHLAYCQPCRRKARLAGVDESFVKPRTVVGKLAALLPFPIWRWPWGGRGSGKAAAAHGGSRHLASAGSAKTAAAAGSAAPSLTLGQAALTAAALVAAGVGGGVVTGVWKGKPHRPATVKASPASSVASAGSAAASSGPGAATAPTSVAGGTAASARHVVSHPVRARASAPRHRSLKLSGPSRAGTQRSANNPGNHPGGGGSTPSSAGTNSAPRTGSGVIGAARSITATANATAVSGVRNVIHKTTGAGSRTVSTVGGTARKVVSNAGHTVNRVTSRAGGAVGNVGAAAGNTVNRISSAAGGAVGGVSSATNSAGSALGGSGGGSGSAAGGPSLAGNATQRATTGAGGVVQKVGSTAGSALNKVGSAAGDGAKKVGATAASFIAP